MRGFSSWFAVVVVSALLIAVPLGWWPKDPYGFIKWAMVGISAAAMAAVWLASAAARGDVSIRRNAVNVPLLLFIGWSSISLLISPHRYYVLRRLSEVLFLGLIYFVLVCTAGGKRRRAVLITASMIGLCAISVVGIAHYADFFPAASPWGSSLGRRVYATMLNPNYLAAYIISLFPLALSFFVFGRPGRIIPALLTVVMISASFCLLFTVSWGAWLGWLVAVVLLVTLAVKAPRRHPGLKKLVAILVVIALIAGAFFYMNRSTVAADYSGMKFRFLYWRACLAMIHERPFVGSGLNGFWPNVTGHLTRIIAADYRDGVPEVGPAETVYEGVYAHNEYLGIWLEMGIIGLLLFIWVMWGFFVQAVRNLKSGESAVETAVNVGAVCGMAAMLVQSLVSYPLRLPATTVSCALLMALVGSGSGSRTSTLRLSLPRPIRALIALAIIGCAVHVSLRLAGPLRGEVIYVEARRASFRGDWPVVAERCRAALKYPVAEPEFFDLMGDACEKLGDYPGAIRAFYRKLELKPYDVHVFLKLGKLYDRLGRGERAARCFEEAIELERHDSPDGRLYLADILLREGRVREALALLEEGLDRHGRNWMLRNSLGIVRAAGGERDCARKEFLAARESGGAVPKYNLMVLDKRGFSGKKSSAAGGFIGPRERDWIGERMDKGRSALRSGRYEDARAAFRAVLDAYPEYVPALSNLGIYYMKTQRMEEALDLWRRATALDPGHRLEIPR
ncbi:MAG: tetratricopeptide repeat protein [Candidatus Tritonobacter lacicola]|nr:tetratricopeptide repeat protein [Candidatus Tritonobacter lacicola]